MSRVRTFQRGSAAYRCSVCGKLTRETGDQESYSRLCKACFTNAGLENWQHTDASHPGPIVQCYMCLGDGYDPTREPGESRWCDHPDGVRSTDSADCLASPAPISSPEDVDAARCYLARIVATADGLAAIRRAGFGHLRVVDFPHKLLPEVAVACAHAVRVNITTNGGAPP